MHPIPRPDFKTPLLQRGTKPQYEGYRPIKSCLKCLREWVGAFITIISPDDKFFSQFLPPITFQSGLYALHDRGSYTIHQGEEVTRDDSQFLCVNRLFCWHVDDLWLWNKTGPTLFQFPDYVFLYFFDLFLWYLVPLVTHEQCALRWKFSLFIKCHFSHFFEQLFEL